MRVISYSKLEAEKGIRFSREHIRRLVKAKKFPSPLDLGDHTIGWIDSELDAWLEAKAARRPSAKVA
jgi:prophage regulatory protein